MAVKDVLKVSRKTFFNPSAWLGLNTLKTQNRTIWTTLKDGVVIEKPERTETFEQAKERYDISDADAKEIGKTYLVYAFFFVVLALLDFIYGFYLLLHHGAFLGLVLAFAVCGLLLVQAFKYHFWYFQIKNRKLGCTFKEWLNGKPFD